MQDVNVVGSDFTGLVPTTPYLIALQCNVYSFYAVWAVGGPCGDGTCDPGKEQALRLPSLIDVNAKHVATWDGSARLTFLALNPQLLL